jgi:hypothetical protein
MILRYAVLKLATLLILAFMPAMALAMTAFGTAQPSIPSGQYMSLTMTIDDTKTTFEMTGPDFSWFAFGFDTTTMFGYSLIVEGLDDNRTAVEQNLEGVNQPGSPQATQNINIVSTVHHAGVDLTTIVIERLNNTGDPNDPVFSPSMTSLDIIGAYRASSSPASPSPNLNYHGSGGRGFGTITFSVVPEPATMSLTVIVGAMALLFSNRRNRQGG